MNVDAPSLPVDPLRRTDPPPLAFLPRFRGLRGKVRPGQMLRTIREAR